MEKATGALCCGRDLQWNDHLSSRRDSSSRREFFVFIRPAHYAVRIQPHHAQALPGELVKVPGVGEHTVALLKVTKELVGRYFSSRTSRGDVVRNVQDAKALLEDYFTGGRIERVCLLCMDGKGKSLGIRVVGEGSVNSAFITSRAVVEAALSLNASRAILAHNHVSGLALPSPEDRATTEHLKDVLWSVGVSLEDHLIFADDDMVSLRDSGFPF